MPENTNPCEQAGSPQGRKLPSKGSQSSGRASTEWGSAFANGVPVTGLPYRIHRESYSSAAKPPNGLTEEEEIWTDIFPKKT